MPGVRGREEGKERTIVSGIAEGSKFEKATNAYRPQGSRDNGSAVLDSSKNIGLAYSIPQLVLLCPKASKLPNLNRRNPGST